MKVAASIRALPAGSSSRCEMVGQDAVFDGREKRSQRPEKEERRKQDRHRLKRKADDRDACRADLC